MLTLLEQRVEQRPNHSESWRALARVQKQLGDSEAALVSWQQALTLDSFNAAAHFDLGQHFEATGDRVAAETHLQKVLEIAPLSSYADQVRELGWIQEPAAQATLLLPTVPPSADDDSGGDGVDVLPAIESANSSVKPVGYEIQTFDGSDDRQQRVNELEQLVQEPESRLRAFLETGILYNTNVTLTPISRDLAGDESASFQAFLSPDVDYQWIKQAEFRAGPKLSSYVTLNEDTYSEFNLINLQPGVFAERDFHVGQGEAIGRLESTYAQDWFDGDRVSRRISGTASVTYIRPDLDAIYAYVRLADSQFDDDGAVPTQTSLDGFSVTLGTSRFYQTEWDRLPMIALGADIESADTRGSDYRYRSINLHGSGGYQLTSSWELVPTWGIGFREYPDFTRSPPRDEFFWRLHGRLKYNFKPSHSISFVVGHDRFASDNEEFDTERTEGGLVYQFIR